MKKIGLLITLLILLTSCSSDNSDDKEKLEVNDYYGKWINTQNEVSWNDEYVFSKDNTFTRTKTVNSVTTHLSGTFEIFEREGRANFQLTYSAPSNLIITCSGSGGKSELLYILNGNLENSARMCDYQLTYKKSK
ncbi:hypothetical protein [Flavobacterium sp. LC2016-01]|uniref:hypothetical protein n=1 Tax=Flavobacterium sp. LC2016-01 TaxID=2675876 RepID=UPI0012BAD444|nr:hypothetical protein [Flavobacterium sp. LC2016-01]MTH16650.1 hypothetical protein [Flavobacterium sp. LC2016-01]